MKRHANLISDQINYDQMLDHFMFAKTIQFNLNRFTITVEISLILSDQPFRCLEYPSHTDFLEYGQTGILRTRVVYNANKNGLLPALSFGCRKTVPRQFNGAPRKSQGAWKERKLFNKKSGKVLQNITTSVELME